MGGNGHTAMPCCREVDVVRHLEKKNLSALLVVFGCDRSVGKENLSEVVHLDVVEQKSFGKTFIKHYMVTKEEAIVDFEIRPKRGDGGSGDEGQGAQRARAQHHNLPAV